MDSIEIQYYNTQLGELSIGSFEGKLCFLDFKHRKTRDTLDNRLQNNLHTNFVKKNNDILEKTKIQIHEYLSGTRKEFTIPLLTVGTSFQKEVWEVVAQIGYGDTASYLDIAKKIKRESAVRAVANAIGANAVALIIPCHRVVGANKKLGGYAGGTLAKNTLLELEKN